MASQYNSVHLKQLMPDLTGPFDLTCSPGTDIWDKPPSTHTFNAPMVYRSTTKKNFLAARLTLYADFKDRFDQAGLCMVVKSADRTRWVKTGIEVEFGVPWVGTVVKDEWADWSLRDQFKDWKNKVTVEIKSESDGDLWVHASGPNGQHMVLRSITWWGSIDDETEVWIGPYTAKPAPNGETTNFIAHFEDFSVQTR